MQSRYNNFLSYVFLFFYLISPIISQKLGFCVISSPVALAIWITAWLPIAYCAEPKLFTLIFKIRHTFSLVFISPLNPFISYIFHPPTQYLTPKGFLPCPLMLHLFSTLSHMHLNDPSSFAACLTLFQRTMANTCISTNHTIWFIHYLNVYMVTYCKIHSDPILHWLEIRFICICVISTLTTLLGLEWLFRYLTKLLGITTLPSYKCLIKTCSSSCLNTFPSNKLAQPKALLADYLIIKSQMFSSVSKANHHTYHLLPFPIWQQAWHISPRPNSSSACIATAAKIQARSPCTFCQIAPFLFVSNICILSV